VPATEKNEGEDTKEKEKKDEKTLSLPPPKNPYDSLVLGLGMEIFKSILEYIDPPFRYFVMFTCSPWYYAIRYIIMSSF
jgi:hypothetical protein